MPFFSVKILSGDVSGLDFLCRGGEVPGLGNCDDLKEPYRKS